LNEQVGSTPGQVLLVQQQGLLHSRRRRSGAGQSVSGLEGIAATLAELTAEPADGAERQSEFTSDHGGVGSSEQTSEDALTQRLG